MIETGDRGALATGTGCSSRSNIFGEAKSYSAWPRVCEKSTLVMIADSTAPAAGIRCVA
jgi:hypothetical protein